MSEGKAEEKKVVDEAERKTGPRHRYLVLQAIELATLPKAHWLEKTCACMRISYSPRPDWHYDTNFKGPGKKTMFAYDIQYPLLVPETNAQDAVITAALVEEHLTHKACHLGVISFKVGDVLKLCDAEGRAVIRGHMYLAKGKPKKEGKPKKKEATTCFVATFRTEEWDPVYSQGKGEEPVVKIDWWTQLTVLAVATQLEYAVVVDAGSLPLPPEPGEIEMTVVPGMTIEVAAHDPHLKAPKGSGPILTFFNKLAFDDDPGFFPNRVVGRAWLAKHTENWWPDPKEGLWRDVTSDQNFRQYCFCNAGTEYIKRISGKYLVDLDAILDKPAFAVRDKWEPYGGKAFFDEKGRPERIELKVNGVAETHRPGDQHWEYAKLRIRSGLFVVAAGYHLCSGHLRWANEPQIGTRRYLDSIHPINRLLAPHFYRSALVIAKSLNSLTPERGMLHRSTAFTAKGLGNFFQNCYDTFEFLPWHETARMRGWGDDCDDSLFPAFRDARDLNTVIYKYSDSYVKLYYDSDERVLEDEQLQTYWKYMVSVWPTLPKLSLQNLINFCSNVIFYNSAWHEQIGNVSGYARDPSALSLCIPRGERSVLGTPESNLIVAYITIMTQQRTPRLIGDWTHYFLDERAKRVYHTFHEDLVQHGAIVAQRNKTREFPVLDYDPTYVKMSVSS